MTPPHPIVPHLVTFIIVSSKPTRILLFFMCEIWPTWPNWRVLNWRRVICEYPNKKYYFQDVFFVVPLLLKPHNEWISNKESKGGVMYRLPPTLSTNKKSIGWYGFVFPNIKTFQQCMRWNMINKSTISFWPFRILWSPFSQKSPRPLWSLF